MVFIFLIKDYLCCILSNQTQKRYRFSSWTQNLSLILYWTKYSLSFHFKIEHEKGFRVCHSSYVDPSDWRWDEEVARERKSRENTHFSTLKCALWCEKHGFWWQMRERENVENFLREWKGLKHFHANSLTNTFKEFPQTHSHRIVLRRKITLTRKARKSATKRRKNQGWIVKWIKLLV